MFVLQVFWSLFFLEQPREPRIEIVEGFKPPCKKNENTKLLNQSIFADCPDFDTIPGELELGEDGFKQVKPPRKSNRFILQEFNRVEPKEKIEESKKNVEKCEDSIDKLNLTAVEKPKTFQSSHSRSSKKKYDNCAQQ